MARDTTITTGAGGLSTIPSGTGPRFPIPGDNFSMVLGDVIGSGRNTVPGVQYEGKAAKFTNRQVNL